MAEVVMMTDPGARGRSSRRFRRGRCSASGNVGLLIWGVSADVDMGELVDFFGADPVELEFTASSRRLAIGSKTTSEPQKH